MASTTRTAQFNKVHKVLKKQSYQPVWPDPDRPVLEHLLFAACLENAHYDVAEQAFVALVHNFFDWNEVRVSMVRELAEVMSAVPHPVAAARHLKRTLQSVFESTYTFELEDLRKQNLGPAMEKLRKLDGTTNFSVAYVIQSALGGHAIPVDPGTLRALCVVDLITRDNVKAGVAPGLERAIAKSKGIEFGSLLHQLGADFVANPYAPALHKILLALNPDAASRLPKRRRKKANRTGRREEKQQQKKTERKKNSDKDLSGEQKGETGKPDQAAPRKKGKSTQQKTTASAGKKAAAKKKSTSKKKTAAERTKTPADAAKKGSASAGLSRKKPR